MSLRARLSKTAEEQALHRHLERAGRELAGAMGACKQFSRSAESRFSSGRPRNKAEMEMLEAKMTSERNRARKAERVIRQAMALLSGIGHLTPRWDANDPDLMSETERSQIAQEVKARVEAEALTTQGEGTQDEAE